MGVQLVVVTILTGGGLEERPRDTERDRETERGRKRGRVHLLQVLDPIDLKKMSNLLTHTVAIQDCY